MTAFNKDPKLKNKTNTIWIPLKTESRMIVVWGWGNWEFNGSLMGTEFQLWDEKSSGDRE